MQGNVAKMGMGERAEFEIMQNEGYWFMCDPLFRIRESGRNSCEMVPRRPEEEPGLR